MEFHTSWMSSIATVRRNNPLQYQLSTRIFHSSSFFFPLLLLKVKVQNNICKCLTNYSYHKPAKFEENWKICTIQNFDLFDKNRYTLSLSPFETGSACETINDA